MNNQTITTQLTSKKLKGNIVFAYVLIAVGIFMMISNAGDNQAGIGWGALIASYGILHLMVTRLRVWWSHK